LTGRNCRQRWWRVLSRVAAFQNAEFYRVRLPTFGKPRIVSCAELHMGGKLTSFDPPRHFAWQNTDFVIAGLIKGLREMAGRDFSPGG
jgi:hypothetical protein